MTICEQLINYFNCPEVWTFLKSHSSGIKDILIALIGGGFGAYFGAWGAQKIIENQKGRAESLANLNNLNTAITLSYNICNALISAKKNFILGLRTDFDKELARLNQHKRDIGNGVMPPMTPFLANFNLQTLPVPKIQLKGLELVLFEKLAMPTGFITVFSTLDLTCDSLWLSINKRNELIEGYKPVGGPTLVEYFGLPDAMRRINQDYPSSVEAISTQADNAIFFSHLLCGELGKHAQTQSDNFKKHFGKGAPKVVKIDWAIAEKSNLIPNRSGFQEFLALFKEDELPLNAWQKLKKWLLSNFF